MGVYNEKREEGGWLVCSVCAVSKRLTISPQKSVPSLSAACMYLVVVVVLLQMKWKIEMFLRSMWIVAFCCVAFIAGVVAHAPKVVHLYGSDVAWPAASRWRNNGGETCARLHQAAQPLGMVRRHPLVVCLFDSCYYSSAFFFRCVLSEKL